jgi:hypothetical protein
MRKLIAVFLLAAFAALAATQLMATVIPPIGLAPGSPYQLVFATADSINGISGTEATYNAFVSAEAALNPNLPSALWRAVTSTYDGVTSVDANVNAPWLGLPVYNTQGMKVNKLSLSFYSDPHAAEIAYDQFGLFNFIRDEVWTGTDSSGVGALSSRLGNRNSPTFGVLTQFTNQWADVHQDVPTIAYHLYALSDALIAPAPEPTSLMLLGIGFLVICGMHLLRWR